MSTPPSPRRTAAIVAVGDELLSGALADANSAEIAARLAELGIDTERIVVVGDREEELGECLRALAERHAWIVVTGGLGPTQDDVTRHAAARAAGRELVESAAAVRELDAWFAARGVEMPATNLRQALLPSGAELLPNTCGTAPGFALESGASRVFALPGPPREMRAMLAAEVLPRVRAGSAGAGARVACSFKLFGVAEGRFAERAADWLARGDNPEMGVTVSGGVLTATLTARAPERAEAAALLAARAALFRERFGASVYSETGETLEQALARELVERGFRVALAESCTGGLASSLLASVPGISAAFTDGFVTYSDAAKSRRLGVDPELLRRHGAVSREVALAMAAGAARESGAELAVAITGIAGPAGGSAEKPVGLVWFAVHDQGGREAHERRFPPGDRERIRLQAAHTALHLLLVRCRARGRVARDPGAVD